MWARAVAADAGAVAQRLGEALAQHDAGILGGVVIVDVQVALGAQGDVDQAVAAQLLQHVVEEADAGLDVVLAGAVEIDGGGDARLLGGARHVGAAVRRPGVVSIWVTVALGAAFFLTGELLALRAI